MLGKNLSAAHFRPARPSSRLARNPLMYAPRYPVRRMALGFIIAAVRQSPNVVQIPIDSRPAPALGSLSKPASHLAALRERLRVAHPISVSPHTGSAVIVTH